MAHTSMATIVNLQRNTGSATFQVLSIIRRSTDYDLHTKASPKSWTRLEDSSWEPENPGMEASGDTRQDRGNSEILCSLHTKRQRVATQSVADPRVTYIGPDPRDRWIRFHLGSRQAGNGADNKPECQSRNRQPNQSTDHLRTRFTMSLCDALRTNCQSITGSTSKAVLRFL